MASVGRKHSVRKEKSPTVALPSVAFETPCRQAAVAAPHSFAVLPTGDPDDSPERRTPAGIRSLAAITIVEDLPKLAKSVKKNPAGLGRDVGAAMLGIMAALLIGQLVAPRGKVPAPCPTTSQPPPAWNLVDPEGPGADSGGQASPWESRGDVFSAPGGHPDHRPAYLPDAHSNSSSVKGPSYAFVQVVIAGETHDTAKQLWRAIAMSRALRRLSRYPLLLLTNVMELPDGSNLVRRLAQLDVHVLPLSAVEIEPAKDAMRLWKLHLWKITGFEKLIWLDTNGILFRGIDALFDHEEVWVALDDDAACPSKRKQPKAAKGTLLLLKPSLETYQGLMRIASSGLRSRSADEIVADYQSSTQVLKASDASAGACMNISQNKQGLWSMPAFVHGSADLGRCFFFDTSDQVVSVSGTEVNLCHFHPLGAYWRDLFCEAVQLLGVQTGLVTTYCDDAEWYSSAGVAVEAPEERERKPFQICNAWALPPLPSSWSPPIFEVSEEENEGCFDWIKSSDQKVMTKGGHTGRNWCWEGMKEYGCHWHLWEHMNWPEMQKKALEDTNATISRPFSPLKNSDICDARQYGESPTFTSQDRETAKAWFADTVSVHVLTLPASKERSDQISKHLHLLGIDFNIVYGFDLRIPGDYTKAVHEGIIPVEFNFTNAQRWALKGKENMGYVSGTVGCASGHFRVQRVAATGSPNKPISLIFEDDVAPEQDFVPRLWRLVNQELPCDWTAVSLRSGCPYGSCLSPQLSLVLPDENEPEWRCRHGVNYGFQGMLYRTAEILELQKIWKPVVYNETQPHCLDVDVALATLSNRIRYYAVPAVQAPGFLTETNQGSARWDINQELKKKDAEDLDRRRGEAEGQSVERIKELEKEKEEARKKEEAQEEELLERQMANELERREHELEKAERQRLQSERDHADTSPELPA